MNAAELHPSPTTGAVLKEQTLAVGLALRPLGIGVAVVLVVFGVYGLIDNLYWGLGKPSPVIMLPSDLLTYLSLVGVGLPFFIQRGPVTPFRSGLPWTLPVGRARHALLRVTGGWLWLMAAVAVLLLWAVGIPFLSGGELQEPRLFLVASFTDPLPVDPASLPTVLWSIPWWLWLVPFPAATALYLLISALFLATPHPGRWLVGVFLGLLLLAIVVERADLAFMSGFGEPAFQILTEGQHGLTTLITGGTAAVEGVDLPNGESMSMFVGMPTFGRWAGSAGLWIGAGLAILGLAALRHRDGAGALAEAG
jgi:hypothetical protein